MQRIQLILTTSPIVLRSGPSSGSAAASWQMPPGAELQPVPEEHGPTGGKDKLPLPLPSGTNRGGQESGTRSPS